MFKEFKPSSGAGFMSSPLLRRRIPATNHQYMSPQSSRKSRSILGIGRIKKKRSVPEGLTARVGSPESSAVPMGPFCEDPRNLQIKEQVGIFADQYVPLLQRHVGGGGQIVFSE